MNISTKTLIITVLVTLALGMFLGWMLFHTSSAHDESAHTSEQHGLWICSMHPQIRSEEPGSCPICGMELIPISDLSEEGIDPLAVSMSPNAMRLANVSTAIVGRSGGVKTLRLDGKIQEDERRVFNETAHFPGRIERLLVNFTGDYVNKGTVLAYLYSPELVTAQEELFEAYKIRESQPALFRAAQEKLKNWKISTAQIDRILTSGKAIEEFPVTAEHAGYVIEKKVSLGDHLSMGETLYEIADLSSVWVMFDVYEDEIPWVKKGDTIQFTVRSVPGRVFSEVVDYIDPVINAQTRVAKARVVLENKDLQLKPEMFVSGNVQTQLNGQTDQITIPKTAVLWTGKRSVAYVKIQSDAGVYFRMREVVLGPLLGESYVVEDGLDIGEEIAVNGTFSIDAAAQLAGKPSMMNPDAGQTNHNYGNNIRINETEGRLDSKEGFSSQLTAVFEKYLPVKDALVASDPELASTEAVRFLGALEGVDMRLVSGEAHDIWMEDLKILRAAAEAIRASDDIAVIREKLVPLSDQLYYTLKKFQIDVDGYRQFCPMAFDFEGAFWLSDSEDILNPYFGDEMLTCGNVEEAL